jgi:putative flippase GtrA
LAPNFLRPAILSKNLGVKHHNEKTTFSESTSYWRQPKQGMKTLLLQIKFAMTSSVATVVDYTVYLVAVSYFFTPVLSNLLSYSIGIVINFLLQKRFIFLLKGNVLKTFSLSLSFSLIGLVLSTLLIFILTQFSFFLGNQYITKLMVTGIVFFYNFYTKRYAFERKNPR